jgi:hypothetical protein
VWNGTSGIATLIEGLKIARIGGIAMRLQGLQGRLLHLFQATSRHPLCRCVNADLQTVRNTWESTKFRSLVWHVYPCRRLLLGQWRLFLVEIAFAAS